MFQKTPNLHPWHLEHSRILWMNLVASSFGLVKYIFLQKSYELLTKEELKASFASLSEKTRFVQVGPEKWIFPGKYSEEAENLYNIKIRPDDVWIVTFPRSGTTWMQEMVWLIANDFDYEKASNVSLLHRFPWLECNISIHPEIKRQLLRENKNDSRRLKAVEGLDKPGWEILEDYTGRRFIKTHLPFSLLPPNLLNTGCKVIYVARNPKDVAVSYYHLSRLLRILGFVGDFETFWSYFENNLVSWTPYWSHIQEGWNRRNEKNFLFMFYEEMIKNQEEAIQKVADFLEVDISEKRLNELNNHLKFENFRNNRSVNLDPLRETGLFNLKEQNFIRKGIIGAYTAEFTPELEERANKWIEENLKDTDVVFPINCRL